jgi:hypothetical protein
MYRTFRSELQGVAVCISAGLSRTPAKVLIDSGTIVEIFPFSFTINANNALYAKQAATLGSFSGRAVFREFAMFLGHSR